MSDDTPKVQSSYTARPRRRGRRGRRGVGAGPEQGYDDDDDDDEALMMHSSDGGLPYGGQDEADEGDLGSNRGVNSSTMSSSKGRKSWTRSLSPRRTGSQLHESIRNNVISPVVGPMMTSLRRLTNRATRSQSPASREHHEMMMTGGGSTPAISSPDISSTSNNLKPTPPPVVAPPTVAAAASDVVASRPTTGTSAAVTNNIPRPQGQSQQPRSTPSSSPITTTTTTTTTEGRTTPNRAKSDSHKHGTPVVKTSEVVRRGSPQPQQQQKEQKEEQQQQQKEHRRQHKHHHQQHNQSELQRSLSRSPRRTKSSSSPSSKSLLRPPSGSNLMHGQDRQKQQQERLHRSFDDLPLSDFWGDDGIKDDPVDGINRNITSKTKRGTRQDQRPISLQMDDVDTGSDDMDDPHPHDNDGGGVGGGNEAGTSTHDVSTSTSSSAEDNIALPPVAPKKPASDPGRLGSSGIPRKPSSLRSGIGTKHGTPRIPTHTSSQQQKPHSFTDLSLSSSHHAQKPASDPGQRGGGGALTTITPTFTGTKKREKDVQPGGVAPSTPADTDSGGEGSALIVDKTPPRGGIGSSPSPAIERRNLDKESLQHVEEVKDSLRKMRTQRFAQRNKVQFQPGGGSGATSTTTTTATTTMAETAIVTTVTSSKSKTAVPGSPIKPASVGRSINLTDSARLQQQLHASVSSFATSTTSSSVGIAAPIAGKDSSLPQGGGNNLHASSSRFLGEITVDDLEVGYIKTPSKTSRGTLSSLQQMQQHGRLQTSDQSAATLLGIDLLADNGESQHQQKIEALAKSLKKTKKLIKRTCRDVWNERDEIVHLQRTNWSLRKALLQGDVPSDSVTTLNLRLEKTLRKERELLAQIEEAKEEKLQVEAECSDLARAVSEFKDLLDALNTQVVPLLPADDEETFLVENLPGSAGDATGSLRNASLPHSPSKAAERSMGTSAAAAVVHLLDEDDFSDSIHSTDDAHAGVDNEPKAATYYDGSEEPPEPSLSLSHLRFPMK